MKTTREYPLAAFCAYSTQHESFQTTPSRVQEDVEHLLTCFGVSVAVRAQVQAALSDNGSSFSAGFRFDPIADYHDPGRVVVYVTSFISALDASKPPARGSDSARDANGASGQQSSSAASW